MDTSMRSYRQTIAELDQQIARETQRLAKNTQAKRDQIQDQLAAVQTQIAAHEATIATVQNQKRELEDKMTNAEQQGRKLEEKRKELMNLIGDQEQMIKNCEKAGKDSLLPYGRDIKGVLEQINQMRWHGNKPLGPLGAYVKAKDPQTWGDILRNQLRQQLTSFAITDPRDRNQLKDIFVRSQKWVVVIHL